MNTAHNLSIDTLIQSLQIMKIHGCKHIDITIVSDLDIVFKASQYEEPAEKAPLKEFNLKDLI